MSLDSTKAPLSSPVLPGELVLYMYVGRVNFFEAL
jgi:hypothetical protein